MPFGDYTSYFDDFSSGGPTSTTQPIASTSGPSFDWGRNITTWLQLAPNIISSVKGGSYGANQYGQQGGGAGGLNVSGGVPFLGGGSLGISSNTLLLLAVAAVAIFALRK